MGISDHISNVCRSAYFHIRALRHIRPALTEDMAKALAVSMVHSRLDYEIRYRSLSAASARHLSVPSEEP